jgi:hypothetical protein
MGCGRLYPGTAVGPRRPSGAGAPRSLVGGPRPKPSARRPEENSSALLPDRLVALDVTAGPERRRLLESEEIALPDGCRVAPDEVLGPSRPGSRLIVAGDAACNVSLSRWKHGFDFF